MNINPTSPNRITPEQYGISSAHITAFLKGLQDADFAIHSILIMKNSRILAEAYADGYNQNTLQRMYSVSKSFVGIAVGVLAEEGKISLDTPAVEYFKKNPKYAPAIETADERIQRATVRDLLKMTSPYNRGSSYKGDRDTDWVMTFFTNSNGYELKEPGKDFLYDTGSTHLLGALVEEVTGLDFLEYLREKALNTVGFSPNARCVKAPEGYAWGGSGVLCTTRDFALFANLVLQGGVYDGKQLLPAAYVREATAKQTDCAREMNGELSYAAHFYAAGYGYQIWKTDYTEKSFAFLGMGDQNAICIPEKDLLFVCTADNQGMKNSRTEIFELFDKNILQNLSNQALPENPEAFEAMEKALAGLSLPIQKGEKASPLSHKVEGTTFQSSDNRQMEAFTLLFDGEGGTFRYQPPRGEKSLSFGIGSNRFTVLNEPQYSGDTISVGNGRGYRSAVSGAWSDDNTLVLYVQVIDDYLGNMKLTFHFENENTVILTVKKTAEWFLTEYAVTDAVYNKA